MSELSKSIIAAAAGVATVAALIVAANVGLDRHDSAPIKPHHTVTEQAPDWTYAPCSWWADTQYPTIPPYTHTDYCAAEDGTLIPAP
jgi:hypothetical protein